MASTSSRPTVSTCDLRVGGMDCASCASAIEGALRQLEGVDDVRVDVVGGKVRVKYAEGVLARSDLTGAIRRVGYRVEDEEARERLGMTARAEGETR
jgi:Zn2+/Cd2+-exporting ATPase